MQSGAEDLVIDSADVDFGVIYRKLYLPVETAVLRNAPEDACSSLLIDFFLQAAFQDDFFHGNGV